MTRRRGQCLSFTALSIILLSGGQYILLAHQTRHQWNPVFMIPDTPFGESSRLQNQPSHQRPSTEPLNVVILFPDDWKHDSLQDEKPNLIHTPFLSQLASEGIRFTHNAVTSSVCWLSRATLFTGRYASQHKSLRPLCPVFTDFQWWKRTWPYLLQRKAGYFVGHVGKWQYRNDQAFLKNAFNWSRFHEGDHWHTIRDNVTHKAIRKVHAADLAKEDAIQFLRDRPKNVPFAMTVAFYPPKAVGSFTEPGAQWSPEESFYELYKDHHFVPPYNFTEAFDALPDFLKTGISRDRYQQRYSTTHHYEEGMKRYYALVSQVDEAAMHIIQELKQQGVYDRTMIIFTTDNGLMQGAHGLAGKWHPYEESIRVPLIIRDPRIPHTKRGNLDDSFTLNIDLAQTILGAANVKPSRLMQGRDISDLYRSERPPKIPWREDFFYELPLAQFPASAAVVTKEWKYVKWPGKGNYEQLFYLPRDRYELNDLLRNENHTTGFQPDYVKRVLELLRLRYKQLEEAAISPKDEKNKPKCVQGLWTEAFSVPIGPKTVATPLAASASTQMETTMTEKEETVYTFLQELHASKLSFRIVVVGNGAILESTNHLGPHMALSQSPKSGANLVTFASDDKSFELHLQTAEIAKIALVERETPDRTMRIFRLLKEGGQSICSLIVSEDSETTREWFSRMKTKYGEEWQV